MSTKQIREPPHGGSLYFPHIIDDFTWSYSRLSSFYSCKYGFYLSYILHIKPEKRNFFSDYGIFIHKILEMYYNGELKSNELLNYFLIHYHDEVIGKAPSEKILEGYITQAIKYFNTFKPDDEEILGVEKRVSFSVDGRQFVGFIDKVSESCGDLIVTDNKSHNLKCRSKRAKPTKTDMELDEYLRQLYLYSIPIKEEYGKYPKFLVFNCFRSQTKIVEPFSERALDEAKQWALNTISLIREESGWMPEIDFFKCKYICDHSDECEYFQMC